MITAKRHDIYDEKKREKTQKNQQSMREVYNSHDTNTLANQEHVR